MDDIFIWYGVLDNGPKLIRCGADEHHRRRLDGAAP